MEISVATQDDKAAWLPLWQAYLSFYANPLPDEMTDLTFARFLDPAESMSMLVAKEDGRMLGYATYLFHRSTWAPEGYCYLEDLYVDEPARRRGVARTLIEAVAVAARTQGSSRLYWITHDDNIRARALYDTLAENHGFVTYQRPL